MSSDVEQLSREELVAELESVREERNQLEARVDALSKQFNVLKQAITGGEDNLYELEGLGQADNILARLDTLQETVEDHEQTIREIDKTTADRHTTEGRLIRIRQYLVEQAAKKNVNVYNADYDEIQALFGGEISDSWASTLTRKAAGTVPGETDEPFCGFELVEHSSEKNQLRVVCDRVEDRSLLRLKNSQNDGESV